MFCFFVSTAQNILFDIGEYRYKPLIEQKLLIIPQSNMNNIKYYCSHISFNHQFQQCKQIVQTYLNLASVELKTLSVEQLYNKINVQSQKIIKKFKLIDDIFIRIYSLKNYVEHVLNFVIGTNNVYPFLKYCI